VDRKLFDGLYIHAFFMLLMVNDLIMEQLKQDPNMEHSMLSYRPFRIRVIFKVFHNWVLYHTTVYDKCEDKRTTCKVMCQF
jgi:hypothetical protein